MHFFSTIILGVAVAIPLSPNGPYNTNAGPKEGAINVHLVPHTHNDVGWLKTVEELFIGSRNDIQIASVQLIIDSVMESLAVDPNRTFQYVEIAFFSRWWRRANDLQRAQVLGYLKSGQLEFVNGGWVSNDEATPTFVDIIDQHTMGATWISREFGSAFNPTVGFQADPFGHSLFQAKAYTDMGMDAWYFGRSDFQDFAVRKATRNLESIHSGILAGSMDGYSTPDFFWWDVVSKDEPLNDDELLGKPNIQARLDAFVAHCLDQAQHYNRPGSKTQHILLTMGSDFTYLYAHSWFRNMDKLIHYGNLDGRLNIFYSQLSRYTASRHSVWPSVILFSDHSDHSSEQLIIDTSFSGDEDAQDKAGDWFPYCDGEAVADEDGQIVSTPQAHAFWTGYFTSRPTFKRLVRRGSAVLEICRLAELRDSGSSTAVAVLWDALSIAQHHDAVSGTANQRVADDYADRLERAIEDCLDFINSQSAASSTYISMLNDPSDTVTSPPQVLAYFAYYVASSGDAPERTGQASGAYIFRPHCPEGEVAPCRPTRIDAPWVKLRQFDDRVEWTVGPIPDMRTAGVEVVLVFEDPTIDNAGVFWTDTNGHDWVRREVDKRITWDLKVTDPVAGNYYPVTAGIAVCGQKDCLVVAPDRSCGGSSLAPGQIEVMVHRRLFNDDDRGVNEALNERGSDGQGIIVSGTTYFSKSAKKVKKEKLALPVSRAQIRPPIQIAGRLPKIAVPNGTVILQLHRINVPAFCKLSVETDCVLLRLMGTHAYHDQWMVPLEGVLPDKTISSVLEVTLNAGKRVSDLNPLKWSKSEKGIRITRGTEVSIRHGQIRTFVLTVSHKTEESVVVFASV